MFRILMRFICVLALCASVAAQEAEEGKKKGRFSRFREAVVSKTKKAKTVVVTKTKKAKDVVVDKVTSDDEADPVAGATQGAVAGAAVGARHGAATGAYSDDSALKGAAIGAVVGGLSALAKKKNAEGEEVTLVEEPEAPPPRVAPEPATARVVTAPVVQPPRTTPAPEMVRVVPAPVAQAPLSAPRIIPAPTVQTSPRPQSFWDRMLLPFRLILFAAVIGYIVHQRRNALKV
ncbi:MAG: hypothetical protein L3K26_00040 [Candidatus Hydrogenedentes bacterium]|nr:hypothetical protein [Candidatus Hydrogenedentota bacterium]